MVGIFSKFSSRKNGHRMLQSTAEIMETSHANLQATTSLPVAVSASHRIETQNDFKLNIEQPIEPLNRDQPVRCPAPEPSILNDGRIWKARMTTANVRVRNELQVIKDKPRLGNESATAQKRILPSLSAPEGTLLTLLEESK